MLAKKSQRNKRRHGLDGGGRTDATPCRFYWHRPLGALEDCRRLTVQTRSTNMAPLWALPLTLDGLLTEIASSSNNPRRLETVEFDGAVEAWKELAAADAAAAACETTVWKRICQRLARRCPRRLVFFGGVVDHHISFLLEKLPTIQTVELYDCECHDKIIHTLQKSCKKLAEFRMFHCANLAACQADAILEMILRRHSSLRALVLCHTSFVDPVVTARRLFLACEESALDEATFEPMDTDTKAYLGVITKLHRMRHYYYDCRQYTNQSAYSVADDALGVVQSWWMSTHRPKLSRVLPDEDKTKVAMKHRNLPRKCSNPSTGSC